MAVAALLVAIALCYEPLLATGFWTDDNGFLDRLRPLHPGDVPALLSPFWGWFYRPVFLLYFASLLRAFGPDPVAFHAVGLFLHLSNIALLMALVHRFTRHRGLSFLAGIAFGFWPRIYPGPGAGSPTDSSISAVVWISSASTLLAALFSLLALHGWLSFRQRPQRSLFVWTLCSFVLALCSKEDAAALPVMLVAFEWLMVRSFNKPLLAARFYAPFVVAFAVYVVLDVMAYRNYNAFSGTGLDGPLNPRRYAMALRFMNLASGGIWPQSIPFIVIGFTSLLVWAYRYDKTTLCLWLCVLAAALPTTLTAGAHAFGARFFYWPSLLAVAALCVLLHQLTTGRQDTAIQWPRLLVPLCVACTAILARMPARNLDPMLIWMLLFLTISITVIVWRAGLAPGFVPGLIVIVALGTQAEILTGGYEPPGGWALPSLLAIMVASRVCRWPLSSALFCFTVAWQQTHLFLLLLIIAICLLPIGRGLWKKKHSLTITRAPSVA
ncbi:MAG: protein O-mannosyl-transferase [Abditibacteriota bacterium]|nr:protein O-mannosyl-transferase [Abditibacteriota bacterium]